MTARGLTFLEQHKDDRFFLYLHYFPPHAPYATSNPLAGTFSHDIHTAIPPQDDAMHAAELGVAPLSREGALHLRARYDENVRYADEQVRRVLTRMQELGYGEDTLVMVMADHGEEFSEHGHLGHSDVPHELQIRTPLLIAKGPAPQGPGERRDEIVRTVDLFSTICGLFGVEDVGRGEDLFGPSPLHLDGIVNYAQSESDVPFEAYVWPRYKLIADRGGYRTEVYDLVADPDEQSDLSETRPVLRNYLRAQAQAWLATHSANKPAETPKVELDQKATDELKALGYL